MAEAGPPSRSETIRQGLRLELSRDPATLKELSGLLRVSERDLLPHLEQLARSFEGKKARGRFIVEPANCHGCGFEFTRRARLKVPGRCPDCKSERIQAPRFSIDDPEPQE